MTKYNEIGDLTNKVVVITGGTSGIGKEALTFFIKKNATVYFLGSSLSKGELLLQEVRKIKEDAKIYFYQCNQGNLSEVKRVANNLLEKLDHIDVLINNAGVMRNPKFELTVDGIESQMGINFISHYVLTSILLPKLKNGNNPRILNVSSIAAQGAKIDYAHFNDYKKYKPSVVYSNTKLAMMSFGIFLDSFFKKNNINIKSIIVHPGVSKTGLFSRYKSKLMKFGGFFIRLISQTPFSGSLPLIIGAFSDGVESLDFIGPKCMFQTKGYPKKLKLYKKGTTSKTIDFFINGAINITNIKFE
ncbi:MAG: SDR family NAD(P)-dependent oxidoreductase [Acholeplasmatales bacterium]|jgi:NAD(P)-dependent dehydrogenase (short-subunit alcohol dehydrogenase family)|nr:SDR family NAD(P)-dependent oxidoreductase [Acholeplasmatales bacterium]